MHNAKIQTLFFCCITTLECKNIAFLHNILCVPSSTEYSLDVFIPRLQISLITQNCFVDLVENLVCGFFKMLREF